MPVYRLSQKLIFPSPHLAEKDGLLAIGGDLSAERLLLAYANGIFPWFSKGEPIQWWSPDPRFILYPQNFRISKSLKQVIKNKQFTVKFDCAFNEVIEACSKASRPGQNGTWITNEMKKAYNHLHHLGFAHSVETYFNDKLAGGLYGVSLGRAFFGESMFYLQRDASKVAFYNLIQKLTEWEFHFVDAQVETGHLLKLGAEPVPRNEFLVLLEQALNFPTIKGKW
jgi:leucyl/phenylalanyl-tRNA---protein transferase